MDIEKSIKYKLTQALQPEELRVINNSSLHKGHLGDDGSGQTHFLLEIRASKLCGMNRVEAHRMIKRILQDEFNKGLHALEIRVIK
ncbi:MAG TPA: BolA family protein [Rickettsiales bacterium]|nr:BolA family protein [Rickettsiales bacterium]